MAVVLVLDLGTTFLKASLFEEGRMLGVVHRATPVRRHPADRCELDPAEFKRWIAGAIADLRSIVPVATARVEAMTFATQSNSFVLLDADDRPLTSLILWPDARAVDDSGLIVGVASLDEFRHITGVPALTHEFAIAKLRWLGRHEPATLRGARRFCLISDYLTLWLTGRHVTEAGAAGLTGLLDIHRLQWWRPACNHAGLALVTLPDVVRAGTDLGVLRSTTAAELALPAGCRLVAGCLDQYASAIGTGCVADGMICETTGTVLATVRCHAATGDPAPPGVFEGPGFDPDIEFQMNFGSTSANLLEYFHATLGHPPPLEDLGVAAERELVGAGGVVIHPLRDGAPLASCFAEVAPTVAPARVVRAIMETVARALRQQVHALAPPAAVLEIRSAGGGARSDAWLQIKADLLGVAVLASGCPEPTSLGAAMLAARTLGEGTLAELARQWCVPRRRFTPDPRRHAQYACWIAASE